MTAPPSTNITASYGARARRGAIFSTLGYGGSYAMRLVSLLVLSHLFKDNKAALAQINLVGVYMTGLQLFSDIGLGPSLVQNPRGDDPRFINTAWTLQVIRGGLLWIVALAGALPFAAFYAEQDLPPGLSWIIPVVALGALLGGFNSMRLFTLFRHMAQGRLMIVELIAQALALATTVVWAMRDLSVWALVAGGLVSGLAKLILSHFALPGIRDRFCWDAEAARAVFRFGGWIFISTVLAFLVGHLDKLVFAKLIPSELFADYGYALQIAQLPALVLVNLTASIAFPYYSRLHERGDALDPAYRRVRWLLLLGGGWTMSGLIAGGQTAVDLVLPAQFAAAGWMVPWLAFAYWMYLLEATNGSALLAKGLSQWVAAAGLGKLIAMAVFIPVGYKWYGFPGAVAGFALTDAFRYGVSALATHRVGLRGWRMDLGLSIVITAISAAGWYANAWVETYDAPTWLRALTVFVVVSIGWSPFAAPLIIARRARGNSG
ncbi:MAG: oligosaccharide flippase family protein [Planctomycetota bacterium]